MLLVSAGPSRATATQLLPTLQRTLRYHDVLQLDVFTGSTTARLLHNSRAVRRSYNAEEKVDLQASSIPPANTQTKAAKKAEWQRNAKSTSFLDTLTITASAGTGGDGCVSFSRAKYVPYGPPSGGSGGQGGSIYIRSQEGIRSLARISSKVTAGDGDHGKGDWQGGKKGRDVTLQVPVGTIVRVEMREVGPREEDDEGMRNVLLREEYEKDVLSRLTRNNRLRKPASEREATADKATIDDQEQENDNETLQAEESKSDIETSEAAFTDEDPAEEPISELSEQEQMELDEAEEAAAQERRELLNSVWRHYPGPGGAVEGLGADDNEEESMYSKREFHAAEERYAISLSKEMRNQQRERLQQRKSLPRTDEDAEGDQAEDVSLEEDDKTLLSLDLSTPTPVDSPGHLLASGGSGGLGNTFFLSGSSRSPKFATRGRKGQLVSIHLELKVPADVGFIGFPNAGKSTLLRALTGATKQSAKVGGWEFTTLSPNVGVLRMDTLTGRLIGTGKEAIFDSSVADEVDQALPEANSLLESTGPDVSLVDEDDAAGLGLKGETRYTLADLPGLIKGAAENRGLGHLFLRHAERCDTLIYVLDCSPSRPEPWKDLETLKGELESYKVGLSDKIGFVVANKCDTLGPQQQPDGDMKVMTVEEARAKLAELRQEVSPLTVLPVSAMYRQGVEGVAREIHRIVTEKRDLQGMHDGKW